MKIKQLKVQNLNNPLGIGTKQPLLSYMPDNNETGQCQSAYRILVSSSKQGLVTDIGDLWDTGKRMGSENFGIVYEGKEMASRQKAYWKVKIWDESDRESEWSDISCWEMGLLNASDWTGSWIGQGDEFEGNKSAAPMLIHDFKITREPIEHARLYISGLGLFKAYMNGAELADTLFDPGESDAGKTVYYVTYDITSFLQKGWNTLGVLLGNGQYTNFLVNPVMTLPDGQELPEHRYQKNDGKVFRPGICGDKKMIAQVEVVYGDGQREIIAVSDENWSWKESPIIFQNWYGGEDYDGTLEIEDWFKPADREKDWLQASIMQPPGGKLIAREFLPIKIINRKHPCSVTRLSNGNWLVDMGRNGAGFPELHLNGTTPEMRGTWIKMYPAELLREDGSGVSQASCTQSWSEKYHCSIVNSYRVKGSGKECWHPIFAYQGFQYLEVEGFPGEPSIENFRYCIVRTENEKNGSFYSSDKLLNQINDLVEHSIESNMFSAFTDCPQIEKLGWIETSHLMFRSMAGSYDIRSWMKKIIHDILDSQISEEEALIPGNEPAGYVPAIIPEYQRIIGLHKDPNWSGACIFTPWDYYWYYGDITVLKEAYPVMKKYLDYLGRYTNNGILENYAQMGEWGELNEATPKVLVATCSYYRMLDIVSRISELLGEASDCILYKQLTEQVRRSFHKHPLCYNSSTGIYGNGSQASYGCVLYNGLVPEARKKDTLDKLVEAVRIRDYHLSSGEVGLKQVFIALAENGRSDIVYKMVMNKTSPSYRFFADLGLTTLPEYWNCEELWQGMERSRNHAMMGHVKEWLTYFMLGIKQLEPAFKKVAVKPFLPDEVNELKGTLVCPYGEISVQYKREKEGIKTKIILPPGVQIVEL